MNNNLKTGKYFSTVMSDVNDVKALGIYKLIREINPPLVWECRRLSIHYHRILKEIITLTYCNNCQELIGDKIRTSRINEIFHFKLKYTQK